ncbi:hypothetical protein KA047_00015 [Candidatus Saccharibacteria bacterium]|nr:hypothetical protein [Candidatus Saccharibacteria bacterium]
MERYSSITLAQQEGLGRTGKIATLGAAVLTVAMTVLEAKHDLTTSIEVDDVINTIGAGMTALVAQAALYLGADHIERRNEAAALEVAPTNSNPIVTN